MAPPIGPYTGAGAHGYNNHHQGSVAAAAAHNIYPSSLLNPDNKVSLTTIHTSGSSNQSVNASAGGMKSNNFWDTYEYLCSLQNQLPLQFIKQSLTVDAGSNLNLNADRIKSPDWDPIFGALKVNRNLKFIGVNSAYVAPEENETDSARNLRGYGKLKKPPAIRNKERTNKLCRAIKDCLSVSNFLNQLEIFNIPLSAKDCSQIAKGIRGNKTLKTLSLDKCLIGDEGLAIVCKDIQNSSNLNRINFSSCGLTHEGANILATLIKVQALKRHNEAWKDSLRYGRPDLDSMFGIRRITINSNPLVGDRGVEALADAFKSDLWLKALDLQDCGITTTGANHLLDGLKFNAMMHVLDVRLNVNIDRETLQKIMEQVMINSSGNSSEYEWMELVAVAKPPATTATGGSPGSVITKSNSLSKQKPSTALVAKKINKKRRNTNASFSTKPKLSSVSSSSKMKRCKSTGSVSLNKSASNAAPSRVKSSGVPWRAAARAGDRDRSKAALGRYEYDEDDADPDEVDNYADENDYFIENLMGNINALKDDNQDDENEFNDDDDDEEGFNALRRGKSTLNTNTNNNNNNHHRTKMTNRSYEMNDFTLNEPAASSNYSNQMKMISSTIDYEKFGPGGVNQKRSRNSKMMATSRENLSSNARKSEFMSNLDKLKNGSMKDLLIILQKEQETKTQLENMLIELQDDNTKLKSQVSVLRSKVEEQQEKINKLTSLNRAAAANSGHKSNNESNLNRTLLDDDKALEFIEFTLYKYQKFLDFLRNAGLGKLIDINEMNQMKQQQQQKHHHHQQQQSRQHTSSSKLNRHSSAGVTSSSLQKAAKKSSSSSSFKSPKSRSKSPDAAAAEKPVSKSTNKATKFLIDPDELTELNLKSRSKFRNELDDESALSGADVAATGVTGDVDSSSVINLDADHLNLDNLLTNALNTTRSYRRMNSSSVNNSTFNFNTTTKKFNDLHLSEIDETHREDDDQEPADNQTTVDAGLGDQSTLLNLEEFKTKTNKLLDEYKNSKSKSSQSSGAEDIQTAKSSPDRPNLMSVPQSHSTGSTSPATIVANFSRPTGAAQAPPPLTVRSSLSSSKKSIEVEDASQVLSDEDEF